jgi:dienelactone hydrolase
MTYHDYLGLVAAETTYAVPENADAAETELRSTLSQRGADSADVSAWLRAPMTAVRDAPAEPRRFQLVVIAQGSGESPHDQAVIAEFLASHGYVVASCPSQTRISGPMTDENAIGRSAREEAQDLNFLIDRQRREANVLGSRVALVGHSFGARGALIAALTRHDVAAVVSLDGGIGTATGLDSFQGALGSAGDSVTVPILHIYETLDPAMAPNWTLLSSLRASPVWIAHTTAMHHHHFTSLGGLGVGFPKLLSAMGGNDTTTRQSAAVAALVLSFLHAATVAPRFDASGWAKASARAPLRVRRLISRQTAKVTRSEGTNGEANKRRS